MAEEKVKKKLPTAQKRMLQNKKRSLRNKTWKSKIKTAMRSFNSQDDEGKKIILARDIYSLADKCKSRGIFKRNKVARIKKRYSGASKKAKA